MRIFSLSNREVDAVSPKKGLTAEVASTSAIAPGTTVTLDTLGVSNKKVVTMAFSLNPGELYKAKIFINNKVYEFSYQSLITDLVSDVVAGMQAAADAVFDRYFNAGSSVVVTNTDPTITFTSEVNGLDFSLASASPGIGIIATTTALKSPYKSFFKLHFLNQGADPMFIRQDGFAVLVAPGGGYVYEFLNPYNGDLTVVGTAGEAFTCFATIPEASGPIK